MGISIWQLLIILAIVLLLFGAKRLRNLGGDLGEAVKGFRKAVKDTDEEAKASDAKIESKGTGEVIEGEVTSKNTEKS
ncbi:MAG: preprotein translocase subunit TatA [Gammaproteobacteria bacterium SG8_47]|nr:MAG: preprotein translocase subunit TatA [Gammaproteobacteria bacterium SG8_47]